MTLQCSNDIESTQKTISVIIAYLNSEHICTCTCKLINSIPVLRLLISSLPGSASRIHVESLDKPRNSTNILKALPSRLDIKRTIFNARKQYTPILFLLSARRWWFFYCFSLFLTFHPFVVWYVMFYIYWYVFYLQEEARQLSFDIIVT